MGEAGIFAPDARLELIEGEIIDMAPIGTWHGGMEFLVVDVNGRTVHVHRDLAEGEYRTAYVAGQDDRIECAALREVWVSVKELFA